MGISGLNRFDNRVSIDKIRSAFEYDPITGILINKVRRGPIPVGAIAGNIHHNGHRRITYLGRQYEASHIIWAIYYGKWPDCVIDHEDMNPDNNAISNLREASNQQNGFNRKVQKNSLTGIKGVCRRGNKFVARITINKKMIHLGTFNTIHEAADAYDRAALERDTEFNYLNKNIRQ